jgi:hypothetical protein
MDQRAAHGMHGGAIGGLVESGQQAANLDAHLQAGTAHQVQGPSAILAA